MITLQNANSTSFTTQGFGSLTDAVKCMVVEEINGTYELVMEYPITGIHYEDIKLRRIINCKPNPYSDPQPFRIYYISKPINRIVTINAAHISYDLSGFPVNPFKATSAKDVMSKLKSNATISHNFTFNSTVTTTGEVNVEGPRSTRSVLGNNVLSAYGGEFEFDGYMIYHHAKRGFDRNVSIRYGKNLTDINQEENMANMYTGVYPYWSGYEYNEETGEQGKQILVVLPEKIVPVDGTFDFEKIYPLDLSSEFSEPPTEAKVREKAVSYIKDKDLGVPKISIDVSFVQLSNSTEYSQYAVLEEVQNGDRLTVEFMEAQISATARCIKTTYNVLTDKYDSITLGEGKSNLASSLSESNNAINDKLEEQKQFFDAQVGNIKIGMAVIDTALIGKADIEYLEANYAHITNGVIDNATIGDATITEAKIADATITNAKIADATITVAKIQDAFVDNLVANQGKFESAHIGKLTAENIQAGTITATEIATGTITAASGIIADGAIGNAQISNIDANKINAGEIDTSKIKIVGENGFLFIENNTLYVVDENRQIRCELGVVEDGTNYGFIVRGADGTTVLLDQNGVRNAGITDGAIDNRTVSENANISGNKLDINSVIRTINEDGSVKIQGTVVQVGTTTLDVKLSEQTNLITENKTQLETQQSQINANTNSISLKVDSQTYISDKDAMTTQMNKNTSAIELLDSEIALKVEQTDINTAITASEGRTDTKIASAKAEIKVTTDSITQRVSDNETTTTTIANDLGTLEAEVTTTTNRVATIETDMDSITQRVDSAETTVSSVSNELTGIKTDVTNTKNQVALLETDLDGITQRVSNTESSVSDVSDTLNGVSSQVSKNTSQIATIDTSLSGITQRVTQTESNVTSINGKITNHETRLASAETKITPSAIVSTVTGSSTYQNDLGSKASVSSVTSLTQDLDSFEFKVQSTGAGNLLKNGHLYKVFNIAQAVQTTPFQLDDDIVGLLQGQKVSIAFDAQGAYTNSTNASMFGVELRINYADGTTDWFNCSTSNAEVKPTLSSSEYRRWVNTNGMTVKNKALSGVAVYYFGRYCDGTIRMRNAVIQIGITTGAYVPHKSAIIDGTTTIDANGVTVDSFNSNIITTMNSNGFVVKRKDNSKELFKVSGGNLTMEGVLRTGTSGQRIEVSDSNYKVYDGSTDKAFFGFRNFENSYTVPKFYMGAYGFDMNSHNYFGITPYRGNNDNPQGSGAAYVDLSYRSITHLDWSNIKMYSDGNIRMAPIQNFEITTNFVNGSYANQNERRLAMFTTSSVDGFNSNMQIGMVANHSNSYGLILADRFRDAGWDGAGGASSGSAWRTAVRVNTDSSNGKFFRPLTTEKNIQCGSGSYPWSKVYSANGVGYSDGVVYNAVTPLMLTEITPENVLDNINIIDVSMFSGKSSSGILIDVTNILNTPYAESIMEEGATEASTYINEGEMVKLLLMEIKNLKETVKNLTTV